MPLPEKPVAANWRSDVSPMNGRPVVRLDHLPGPVVRDAQFRQPRERRLLERAEARHGVVGLPRLVILAAEDYVVEVAVRIHAQVVIRISRVPETGFRNRPFRHLSANDI
jgi:hypothetical protein